jgi:hypothetical protein
MRHGGAAQAHAGMTGCNRSGQEPYTKGYKGRREDVWKPVETDYRLSYPTNVRKVV